MPKLIPMAYDRNFQRWVETMHEGVWVIGRYANTACVNRRIARMPGNTAAVMITRHRYSSMHEQGVAPAGLRFERRKQGAAEDERNE